MLTAGRAGSNTRRSLRAYKEYLGRKFHYQGTGDWNYFKLFLENNLTLLKTGGRLVILVPSGIQTDEGCAALRKLLTTEHTLLEITSFENRGYTAKVNGDERDGENLPGRGQPLQVRLPENHQGCADAGGPRLRCALLPA